MFETQDHIELLSVLCQQLETQRKQEDQQVVTPVEKRSKELISAMPVAAIPSIVPFDASLKLWDRLLLRRFFLLSLEQIKFLKTRRHIISLPISRE